ncbi:MAG: hypothetical protein POH28_13305 [Acidocella sp.]|nr:hypothetical protein [Acidocella sp.]
MRRRRVMSGILGAAMMPAWPGAAVAGVGSLNLLVGGPPAARTSRWGNACALAMQAGFPGTPQIITQAVGGLDGVTGANQLDALVVPDGRTAAILPGAALIAWLTGDSRVHFDPTRWIPVMAGSNSGVLVVRPAPGKAADLAGLRAAAPLRLAADQPQSNDLAALLALAGMGVATAPVFGLRDIGAKTRAFLSGEVNAVFVSGEGVPEDIAPLSAGGGVPVFSLGGWAADGTVMVDPLFPQLPDVAAFGAAQGAAIALEYQAAAAAARLDFIVVLPKLTAPGAVAQWRQAGLSAMGSAGLAAAARASSVILQPAAIAVSALSTLSAMAADQGNLQAFLVQRFGWQPG